MEIEDTSELPQGVAPEVEYLASIAISLKRIADAMQELNVHVEVGLATISGMISRVNK